MHNDGVISFLSILFKYPLGGGGGCSGSFIAILQKKIFILLFTHYNTIFLTLDEIEFGVSDLGM